MSGFPPASRSRPKDASLSCDPFPGRIPLIRLRIIDFFFCYFLTPWGVKLHTSIQILPKICMTSASELFLNRRSRLGTRNPNPLLAVDPTLVSDVHRLAPRRRLFHRHVDGCGHPRHRASEAEQELLQSDVSSSNNSRAVNNNNGGAVRGRVNQLTLIRGGQGSEQLPGTVLQARARLVERLRGVSVSETRQNIVPSGISRNESVVDDDLGFINAGEWEIEAPRDWIESNAQENVSKKKPPGLSSETICSLPQENFSDTEENDGVVRVSTECGICLERFAEGESLFRLPCCHRFHPSCLEPWLRNCGDCPYCRASI